MLGHTVRALVPATQASIMDNILDNIMLAKKMDYFSNSSYSMSEFMRTFQGLSVLKSYRLSSCSMQKTAFIAQERAHLLGWRNYCFTLQHAPASLDLSNMWRFNLLKKCF